MELDLARAEIFAGNLARQAGQELLKHFGSAKIAVQKGDKDYATEADLASERIIIDAIQAKYPEHDILSEEAGSCRAAGSRYRWVIDPLDGTHNFFHGLPLFAVSIALQRDGESVVGAAYLPITDELFSARLGGGARLNGTELRLEPKQNPSMVSLHVRRNAKPEEIAASMEIRKLSRDIRSIGACVVELALIAKGSLDARLSIIGSEKIWDTAAARLLVTEAGGIVRPLIPAKPSEVTAPVAAFGSQEIHDQIEPVIRQWLMPA